MISKNYQQLHFSQLLFFSIFKSDPISCKRNQTSDCWIFIEINNFLFLFSVSSFDSKNITVTKPKSGGEINAIKREMGIAFKMELSHSEFEVLVNLYPKNCQIFKLNWVEMIFFFQMIYFICWK